MNFNPLVRATPFIGAALLVCLAGMGLAKPPTPEWTPLFNGKNLDGWSPKFKGEDLGVNYLDTFGVRDGVLRVSYDKYKSFDGRFGHLFYKSKFKDYKLRVEYRFVGDQVAGGPGWAFRNNGVMIFSQSPESLLKDQDFPVSIEVQLLGGDGKNERHTANVCTPGTNIVMGGKLITQHCIDSKSKTYHGDQWVTVELEVHGNAITKHVIDGETVFEYEQPQLDPNDADGKRLIKDGQLRLLDGYIAIQAESHPTEFRKIQIQPL
ncbi:MAG: DUF1080 domain-containing protein [Fimbriimonas sp.]